MNAHELCPSMYVAAADLRGRDVVLTIANVQMEEVSNKTGKKEMKGVVYFAGHKKGMIINKTNLKRVMALYGDDTDKWMGKPITLYASETDFGGETVACLRVREQYPESQDTAPGNGSPAVQEPAPQEAAQPAAAGPIAF